MQDSGSGIDGCLQTNFHFRSKRSIKREEKDMKKVYLFCSAGMSTSMLAAKMQEVANSHQLDMEVAAFPHEQIGEIIAAKHPDCILLGPTSEISVRSDSERIWKDRNSDCSDRFR